MDLEVEEEHSIKVGEDLLLEEEVSLVEQCLEEGTYTYRKMEGPLVVGVQLHRWLCQRLWFLVRRPVFPVFRFAISADSLVISDLIVLCALRDLRMVRRAHRDLVRCWWSGWCSRPRTTTTCRSSSCRQRDLMPKMLPLQCPFGRRWIQGPRSIW